MSNISAFQVEMPTRDQYESFDFSAELKKYKDTGDTTRMSMLIAVGVTGGASKFFRKGWGGRSISLKS